MINKHYENEDYFKQRMKSSKVTNVITVRLSGEELILLQSFYPNKTISYAIRSLIHEKEYKISAEKM